MKIIQINSKNKESDNLYEMQQFFRKRTEEHIKLVRKYMKKTHFGIDDPKMIEELEERALVHDHSKFESPEKAPYVYITWKYKCKDDGKDFECPDGMELKMIEATEHHVKNNKHHPECHTEQTEALINKDNRDKPPSKIVDATKMKYIDLIEMVADWCAVSEERGNTPKEWADKNINVRWKFTDDQKEDIYKLIDIMWR